MHVGGKCKKWMDGWRARQTQSDDTRTWSLNKVIWKISAQYVKERRRKVWKTVYFQYSKSQKGHYSNKNWCPLTTLEVDVYYIKTKSCAKFQLNMSERVREKCGKKYIQYSTCKFEKRHNCRIDANWRHSKLICSTEKQSNMQTFSSIC